MHTTEIPRREWTHQLDQFSKAHDGWLVSLNVAAADKGAQAEFRLLPLVGVTSEPGEAGTISIGVAEPTGQQVTHTIHSPRRVWIEKTDSGADAMLEIEATDGTKSTLRFRSAVLPQHAG